MSHFEVEIKSLLGESKHAESLVKKMCDLDPSCECTARNKQLNHYFTGGDIHKLYKNTEHLFSGDQHKKIETITERGEKFSVRTRQRNDEVLLVIKASMDEGTSENTVARMEFEEPVAISLDELDQLVLDSDYEYQAKWSRERDEYVYKETNVCIDRNAGYGYLAEFEKITHDESSLPTIREELLALMGELNVAELPQSRLARMFEFYNNNWADYYGTDKTFNIE